MTGNYSLPIRMETNVNIDSTPPLLQGNNINELMIVTSQDSGETSVKQYFDLNGVAKDFAVTTNEYKLASKLFAQNPRPKSVKIAKVTGINYPSPD